MVAAFDIDEVNQSASAINPDKLLWLNQHYIKEADPDALAVELAWHLARIGVPTGDGPPLAEVVRCQQERAKTLVEMAHNSRFFFVEFADYEEKAARKNLNAETLPVLEALRAELAGLPDWTAESVHNAVEGLAERAGLKLGKVAQPLRVAVAGCGISPPIDRTLALLGRERTLARVDRALAHIAG
jgi:glutamyl-tRNA synthetase